jgi:hypothetical protein
MIAVLVSDLVILKRAASAPEDIVTVADSETWIVAAVADVAMFSAAENVEEDVNVGAVVSGDDVSVIVTNPVALFEPARFICEDPLL